MLKTDRAWRAVAGYLPLLATVATLAPVAGWRHLGIGVVVLGVAVSLSARRRSLAVAPVRGGRDRRSRRGRLGPGGPAPHGRAPDHEPAALTRILVATVGVGVLALAFGVSLVLGDVVFLGALTVARLAGRYGPRWAAAGRTLLLPLTALFIAPPVSVGADPWVSLAWALVACLVASAWSVVVPALLPAPRIGATTLARTARRAVRPGRPATVVRRRRHLARAALELDGRLGDDLTARTALLQVESTVDTMCSGDTPRVSLDTALTALTAAIAIPTAPATPPGPATGPTPAPATGPTPATPAEPTPATPVEPTPAEPTPAPATRPTSATPVEPTPAPTVVPSSAPAAVPPPLTASGSVPSPRDPADPPAPTGPRSYVDDPADAPSSRARTRLALQSTLAMVLAFVVGQTVFPQHWPWAAVTVLTVSLAARSRGEVVVRSGQRLAGAGLATVVATPLATAAAGHPPVLVAAVLVILGAGLYLRERSYVWWAVAVTASLAALYALLGQTGGAALLRERLLAIVLGAVCAIGPALVWAPRTRDLVRKRTATALRRLRDAVAVSPPDVVGVRRFDAALVDLADAAAPLRLLRRVGHDRGPELGWVEALTATAAPLRAQVFAPDRAGAGRVRRVLGAVAGEVRAVTAARRGAGPAAVTVGAG